MSTLVVNQGKVKLGNRYVPPDLEPFNEAPAVLRPPPTDGEIMSENRPQQPGPHTERCMITSEASYMHVKIQWISDVQDEEFRKMMDFLMFQGIVSREFSLHHPSNFSNFKASVYSAMNYELVAVTCSISTLDSLIQLLQRECKVAQENDAMGNSYVRDLELLDTAESAEYELVVLHPKHYLSPGTGILRYDEPNFRTATFYGLDSNGVLREMPTTESSPRFPPSRFMASRTSEKKLNPYFVIMDAEIKFRRFRAAPDATQLDEYYEALIDKTIQVADLIYSEPVPGRNAKHYFSKHFGSNSKTSSRKF